ncbi:amino acid permease [Microdochium bolleyi]|uniref:Amino acid permease n=1 Tax=Microdochium bolleyi TaxID=196109 RepID=A0A136IQR7_9PEZI|nr:amino acid permease [Microdochium bolleyi]
MSASKYFEKGPPMDSPTVSEAKASDGADIDVGQSVATSAGSQALHRKLRGKEVQLFAIGGAIGTSLYVQMGSALPKGGPAGLFLGFVIWGSVMWAVNECFAEMVTYLPVPSPFVRFASEWVDQAVGFAMAWNFFLNMAFLVPFEIVAMNIMFTFWTDKIPVEAIVVVMIVLYALLNVITVRYFGIAEFYLSIFKVGLMIALFFFTLITMSGGNPIHDAYGFRFWGNPGAFVEYFTPGDLGRFLGIFACMYQASFSVCGPEYISMVAAETENPRKTLHTAYKAFPWRILFFFIGSALCMGIVIPYNDPTLSAILGGAATGKGTGAASPYIIAMNRLQIPFLPHLTNALIMTSIFSAGNGILFSATRVLHGMSLSGHAPRIFSKCTKAGVPIYALFFALSFCLLAFLQSSRSSAKVMTYLVDLVTCCQLLNYGFTAFTYRHFYASLQQQGVDRGSLPYRGRWQPYTSYYAMGGTLIMLIFSGWSLFTDGGWDVMWFFLDYGMIAFFVLAYAGWKIVKRTKYVRPGTADLSLGGLKEEIDTYETLHEPRKQSKFSKWLGF